MRHKKEGFTWSQSTPAMIKNSIKLSLVLQQWKTQSSLCKEYGFSPTTLGKWIKQYASVETENGDVLTAKQIKELQKRMAPIEEENLILKK